MKIHMLDLHVRSRPAAIALAAAAVAVGLVFVAFGIFLLLGLAAVATVIGAGILLFRALTGRGAGRLRRPHPRSALDPSMEVFPPESAAKRPPDTLPG